ncbi:transposase [Nonomuraea sp. NPDC026600]|uniref:transposase n=1 Tax=Nonomuraea sp. NPDC026600 TaxID=3155363 RepID=UPI0033D58AFD
MTCPSGKTSIRWAIEPGRDKSEIRVEFSQRDCSRCPVKAECTRSRRRRMTLRPQAEHEVLARARAEQQTDQWKNRHQARQGIEATIAQGVKAFGLRRSRYRGTGKTHLQHPYTSRRSSMTTYVARPRLSPKGWVSMFAF